MALRVKALTTSLLVALGCSNPSATPAADGQEASDDAPLPGDSSIPPAADCDPDAAFGPARVHAPFQTILVHDTAGNLLTRIEPTLDRYVDVDVPGCGSVTRAQEGVGASTVLYVSPGDELFDSDPDQGNNDGQIIVDVPFQGAEFYAAQFGECGGTGAGPSVPSTVRISSPEFCPDSGLTTVMVFPGGVQLSNELVYAVFEDVVLADTLQSPPHVTEWTTSAPLHQFSIELSESATGFDCGAYSMAHGHRYRGHGAGDSTTSTQYTLDVHYPEFGSGAGAICRVINGDAQRAFIQHVDGSLPASVELSESQLLPEVTGLVHGGDLLSPSWTTTPEVVQEDMVVVRIFGGNTFRIVVAPPGTRALHLPDLPSDLTVPLPSDSATQVHLFEASDVAGYRAARVGVGAARFLSGVEIPTSPLIQRSSTSVILL